MYNHVPKLNLVGSISDSKLNSASISSVPLKRTGFIANFSFMHKDNSVPSSQITL